MLLCHPEFDVETKVMEIVTMAVIVETAMEMTEKTGSN
jgi:hypothetical protein